MITCLSGIAALITGLACGVYTLTHMDSSEHSNVTAACATLTYPLTVGGGLAALIGAGLWIG